jgi:hypothetical protein
VPLGREQGFKLDRHLRCHRCARTAYGDRYEGELVAQGYLCGPCIRLENQRVVNRPIRESND